MKIGFIYDAVYPDTIGGVEKRIYEIGTRLARRGHDVHLFGMKYWDGPDIIVRDGLVIHGVMPACQLYINGRRRILPAIIYAISLFVPLIQNRMDVIECQNFPYFSCFTATCISFIRRIPIIIVWHEFWGDYWYDYIGKLGFFGILIERICICLTPHQVVDARLISDAMRRVGSSISPQIIPCGTDSASIKDVLASPMQSDVIFVGRLIPEKHPEVVIRAIALIKKKMPAISAIIIGDGPQKEEISRLIQELHLEKNITLLGFVPDHQDIIAYMKSSRVCVLPSEREGFGIVGIEAIMCGLFFITSHHARNAAKELVHPWNGITCDISSSSIADAIYTRLHSFKYDIQDTEKERSNFIYRHEWDTITDQIEGNYTAIVTSHHQ